MDAPSETRVSSPEMMDTEQRNEQFIEGATRLNQELEDFLDGQQVTRESLDVVISV